MKMSLMPDPSLPHLRRNPGETESRLSTRTEPLTISHLARRNRATILIPFGIGILGAVCLSLLQTPMYRAQALIEVQGLNQTFLKSVEYEPNSSSGSTAGAFLATQIKLLKSEAVAKDVVERIHLNEDPLFFRESPGLQRLKQLLHLPVKAKHDSVSGTALRLMDSETAKIEGDSDLISIAVDAPDPDLAAKISNALASEYIRLQQQERWNTSVETSKMLTAQVEDFRVRLQQSERELQDYAKSAGLIFTDEHSMASDEKLRLVQADLSKAQADRADKEAELSVLTSSQPDSLPKVLDDGPLRDLRLRLTELRRQVADLSTTLTPQHYKVESLKAEIDVVEAAINRERSNVLSRIQNEYAASLQREHLLGGSYQNQVKIVTDNSAKAVRYNVLKRDLDANRELYGSMLQKVREASVLSTLRTSSMRLADLARPPFAPYKPNLLKNFGIGGFCGLLFAMLAMLARERFDHTLKRRGEITDILDVPELGVIPSVESASNARRLPLILGTSEARDKIENSLFTEAFRSTATSISSNAWFKPKVFLITSPHPQAGKSTVVANLGAALARAGARSVLVDGDLRRPALHSIFSVSRSPGLADILHSKTSLPTITAAGEATRPHSIPNLNLITAGDCSSESWELLQSMRMAELLQQLRRDYDFVIVDSPPMLHLNDARILARLVDAVVLVCRAGYTQPAQIRESERLLAVDGSKFFGTILNDWNVKTEDPAYFKSYYSHYGSSE